MRRPALQGSDTKGLQRARDSVRGVGVALVQGGEASREACTTCALLLHFSAAGSVINRRQVSGATGKHDREAERSDDGLWVDAYGWKVHPGVNKLTCSEGCRYHGLLREHSFLCRGKWVGHGTEGKVGREEHRQRTNTEEDVLCGDSAT